VRKGVIFATYSSLIGESHSGGKYKTRFKQLIKWFGKDFDGCVSFDTDRKAIIKQGFQIIFVEHSHFNLF